MSVEINNVKKTLFGEGVSPRLTQPRAELPPLSGCNEKGRYRTVSSPLIDESILDIYERVQNPNDPIELCRLFMARVEAQTKSGHVDSSTWLQSRKLRSFSADSILNSPATVGFVKELFNTFFRDDLYGLRRNDSTAILSTGSVCEESFGLTTVGKAAISYALDRDWYGYSDSNGLISARSAIAALENDRLQAQPYSERNVAITLGATHAISNLAEMILSENRTSGSPPLVAIPNYPPLVRSISRHGAVQLVPLEARNGSFDTGPLLDALRADTPLVMLQTVSNPTGARVNEDSLGLLIEAASPSTVILLDECHEFLGNSYIRSLVRARRNVVRIHSLSKTWSAPGIKVGWILGAEELISRFYEQSSTSYGGPASIFYTLIEVICRFDRWRSEGLSDTGREQLSEFGQQYTLQLECLQRAYHVYLQEYEARERGLLEYRSMLVEGAIAVGLDVMDPKYSINALMFPPDDVVDSYAAYRMFMEKVNVATYPGILNFGFGSNGVRITSSRPWGVLSEALTRLEKSLERAG